MKYLVICILLLQSCALRQSMVQSSLQSSARLLGQQLLSESDPLLAGQSLPVLIEVALSTTRADSTDPSRFETAGMLLAAYAGLFTEHPERQTALFARAHASLGHALKLSYPQLHSTLKTKKAAKYYTTIDQSDSALCYWFSASWLAEIGGSKQSMRQMFEAPHAARLLRYCSERWAQFGAAKPQQALIQYYTALGAPSNAPFVDSLYHVADSIGGSSRVGIHYSYAKWHVKIAEDTASCQNLLNRAGQIDVERYPQFRLENQVYLERFSDYASMHCQ